MKCKSTINHLKCTVFMWGYSPTHTQTLNSSRTNRSIIWSVTFRVRECIGCLAGSRTDESAHRGWSITELWLQMWQEGTRLVFDRSEDSLQWRGFPKRHSQTCTTASTRVSLATKTKSWRRPVGARSWFGIKPFTGCRVPTHSRVRRYRSGHL